MRPEHWKEHHMKNNFLYLIGGVLSGIALCLTVAYLLPTPSREDFDDIDNLFGIGDRHR